MVVFVAWCFMFNFAFTNSSPAYDVSDPPGGGSHRQERAPPASNTAQHLDTGLLVSDFNCALLSHGTQMGHVSEMHVTNFFALPGGVLKPILVIQVIILF